MKIPIRPRPSPISPGDGLFILKNSNPFYYDDNVSKVGLDVSDIINAVNKAASAFDKYTTLLEKFGAKNITVFRNSADVISGFSVTATETLQGLNTELKHFANFTFNDKGKAVLANLNTTAKSLKTNIQSLSQDTKDFAGQLARLGTGKYGGKLENIITKLSPPSARQAATPKELATAQKAKIQFQLDVHDLLAQGHIARDKLEEIFSGIHGGIPIKEADLAVIGKALGSFQKMKNSIAGIGAEARKSQQDVLRIRLDEKAGERANQIKNLLENRIGTPLLHPKIDPAEGRRLVDQYLSKIQQITKSTEGISNTRLKTIISAARDGGVEFEKLSASEKEVALQISNLISITDRFGVANERVVTKAIRNAERLAKSTKPPLPSEAEIAATHKLLTGGDTGRKSLIEQLRPGSFGQLPSLTTRGEANRIQKYFDTINKLITNGRVSLDDYDHALEAVINKTPLPRNASADFGKLRDSIAGVGGVLDATENRMKRMNETLISFKNIVRLAIVSELYTLYSQLRSLAEQSITDFNKLSIQISQIQAITQDVNGTTAQWAQTLRKVSDISGKDLTEVSIAAYDALSNQITRTREDTEAFLNTAISFGKTVGATPTEAVNLLSSSINAYGKSAADAEQLSAEFFAVIDIGRVKAADLQNILGRVGITASTLGVKTYELGAALAVLTQNGLTTEDAITRLNNLLVKLFNPTKEMEKLFAQFGVTSAQQFIAINGGLGGTVRAIEEVVKRGDALTSELFPEIRTLAGYFGLSGQNAVKFADAIDKVEHSIERFKGAKALTDQASVGQRFETEIQKIKNVFTVDFAEGFSKAFINLSDLVGGLAERIKNLLDIASKVGPIIASVLSVSLVIKNLARLKSFIEGFKALIIAAFTVHPVGRFIAITLAALTSIKAVYDTITESVDNYNKKLSEGRIREVQLSPYSQEIDRMGKAVLRHAEVVKEQITKAWSQAAANSNLAYTKVIDAQRIKIEGLVNKTKSSFSDVSNLISKTISALENYGPEASKVQRKLPFEQSQFSRDTQVNYLQQLLNAQKEFESQAGFKGVSGQQVAIYDQIVEQINQGTEKLRQEANKVFNQTLDPSEQKAAVDAYLESVDKAIAEYTRLRDEIISTGVAAGRSGAQIQAQLDAIVSPRLKGLFDIRSLNIKAFGDALEKSKESLKDKLTPLYELEAEVKALNSKITDLDVEKAVAETHPIYEDGRLVKSRQQVFNEKYLQPIEDQRKQLGERLNKLPDIFGSRGIKEALDTAFNKLNRDIDQLKEGRKGFISDIISKKDIETATANLDAFEKAYIQHIKILNEENAKFKDSRAKLFEEIQKQADILNKRFPSPQEVNVFGGKNVEKVNNAIDFLKEQSNVGRTSEEKINNIRNAAKAARDAFEELKKTQVINPQAEGDQKFSPAYLGSRFKAQEDALIGIEEALGKIDVVKSREKTNIETIEELEASLGKLKITVGGMPEELKKNADAFKQLLDSLPPDRMKEIIEQLNAYTAAASAATQIQLPGSLTGRTPADKLINNTSPPRLDEELNAKKGVYIEPSIIRNYLRDISGIPRDIPTIPSKVPGTQEVVPTAPVQGTANEQTELLRQILEATVKNKQEAVVPQTESMGGLISYYVKGGWAWMKPKGTDTVPAMLTPGEFVMPRDKTQKYLPLLERMRAGYYSDGGEILAGKGDLGNRDRDIVTFMADGGQVERSINELSKYWASQPGSDIGSAKNAYDKLHRFASLHPQQIIDLAHHLHDSNTTPRRELAALVEKTDTLKSSQKLLSQMHKGASPSISLTNEHNLGKYDAANKRLLLSTSGYDNAINSLAVLSHELEHAKQGSRDYSKLGTAVAELPSVFGDIAFGAKSYELSTGKKLDKLINISPTSKISASQLADIFESQGYFKGRSATEILSTPEGQSFLRKLINTPYRNYQNNIQPQTFKITPLKQNTNPTVFTGGGGYRSESFGLPNINLIGGPDANIVRNILGRIPFGFNFASPLQMAAKGGVIYADSGGFLNPTLSFLPPLAQAALAGIEAYGNYSKQNTSTLRDLDPTTLKSLKTPSLKPLSKPLPSFPVVGGGGSGNYSFGLPDINTIGGMDSNIVRSVLGSTPFGWNFSPPLMMAAKGGISKGTDTVPAMLTPGEFIMPRDKTEKYLPALEQMRKGKYMAEGGVVSHINNKDNLSGFYKDRKEPSNTTNIFNRNKHDIKDYSKTINDHGTKYHIASGGSLESHKSITSYYIKGGLINVESREGARHMATNNTKQYLSAIGDMVQNVSPMRSRGKDNIPAMLSKGEYIMPSKQTEKYLPVLEGMRRGVYMAEGGMLTDFMENLSNRNYPSRVMVDLPDRAAPVFRSPLNKISSSIDNSRNTHVNIHVNMNGSPVEHEVGRKIGKEIQREIRRGNLKLS